jgi:hypothetical protein
LRAHVLDARDPRRFDPPPALSDRVLDKNVISRRTSSWMARTGSRQDKAPRSPPMSRRNRPRHSGKIDEARAQGVVEVVRVIGDAVGERRGLCLGAGEMRKLGPWIALYSRIAAEGRARKTRGRLPSACKADRYV